MKPICCFDTSVTSGVPWGRPLQAVMMSVCADVWLIACLLFCLMFSEPHTHTYRSLAYGFTSEHMVGAVSYVRSCMCELMGSVRCYCVCSAPGWQVFAGLSGPVRFPCRPEALEEAGSELHRAWLKDAPLISPVRKSVNSLQMTSSGPADQPPSVST